MRTTAFKKIIFTFFLLLFMFVYSCGPTTEDIAERVKTALMEQMQNDGIEGFEITSLDITDDGDSKYSGLLHANVDGVDVQYDIAIDNNQETGEMTWDITNRVIK